MGNGFFFLCVLVLDVYFSISLDICSPCNQDNLIATNVSHETSCKHKVSIDNIKTDSKMLIQKFNTVINAMKIKLAPVNVQVENPRKVRVLYPYCGSYRKIKRKVRFIHETYANLTLVYKVLENVSRSQKADDINASSLQPIMCSLYQANRNLQCANKARRKKKKIRGKKIRKIKMTKDCRSKRKRFRYSKQNNPKPDDIYLLKLSVAQKILQETFMFWETHVEEKDGTLMLKQNAENKTDMQIKIRCKHRKSRRRKKTVKNSTKQSHGYYLLFVIS